MDTLRCVVIDDEPLAASLIENYVNKTPNMELAGSFGSAQEAVKTVLSGNIDLVFLDIEMPQLNGIEFAHILPQNTRVIFTTAYENHAISAFRLNALDYLLKPVSYEEFMAAATKAFEWKRLTGRALEATSDNEFIIVRSEHRLIQIPLAKVLYFEGLRDYVKIYVEGQEKSISTLMSIGALEKSLPESRFMRVHRSFIVNKSKIRIIDRNRIVFDKNYVPVSDTYRPAFNDFISNRLLTIRTVSEDDRD